MAALLLHIQYGCGVLFIYAQVFQNLRADKRLSSTLRTANIEISICITFIYIYHLGSIDTEKFPLKQIPKEFYSMAIVHG